MEKPAGTEAPPEPTERSRKAQQRQQQQQQQQQQQPRAAAALESSVASSTTTTDSHPSKQSSASNSVAPSPFGSRESSPIRPPGRSASTKSMIGAGTRSRQNSQHESSPTRAGRSSIPAPQGIPRVLSSATTPVLLPTAQETQAPAPQKPSAGSDQASRDGPRWPVSPRLRSPPPNIHKPASVSGPAISIQRASPSPSPLETPQTASESESEEPQKQQSGAWTPARAGSAILETVQEISLPNSPGPATDAALEKVKEKLSSTETELHSDASAQAENKTLRAHRDLAAAAAAATESGSESGSVKADRRRTMSTGPSPPLLSRQSSALSTKQAKGKPEGSSQTMTVETEVVEVPAQAAIPGNQGGNGTVKTLKTKPSSETIRPKKEKKAKSKKQQTVNPGLASSKADNFEAKIASAVDEANTSDSEETFVYDSNPPDGPDRSRRFHSRTPSATSMASQTERANIRSIYSVMESAGPVMGKRQGKFLNTNTFNSNGGDGVSGEEDGKSTGGRSGSSAARGSHSRTSYHFGRWGRSPGSSHPSLFDNESPFPNASRPKVLHGSNSRQQSGPSGPSGPPSPRTQLSSRVAHNGKRSNMQLSASYDLDDTTGADDERTPLMNSVRSARSSRSRRGQPSLRQLESNARGQRRSYLNRFAACLVVTMMIFLVISAVIGFMFATSQPLTDIEFVDITNVLASEPELMFDLTLKAHNPNIVVVTIDQADLEVFAKSPHAGTDYEWEDNPDGPPNHGVIGPTGLHVLDDPPDDPPDEGSAPNMRLGTITEFDSPLSFEGSFINQGRTKSTGGMRLPQPGNGTAGGGRRWARVIDDEFTLILKGVVKYSLPLSTQVRSASISGRTTVKPNSANDPALRPNSTAI